MSNIAGINNQSPTNVVGFAQDTHGTDTSTCVQDEPNLFLSYEKSNIVAIKLSNRLGVDETESIPADQKACLIRYLNDWEKEISKNGPKDYDIATLSNKLARLTKAGINLLPLKGCSPAQRKSIVMYVSQMLEYGYKVNFANDVCEMMSKLYQYTTECDGKSVTIESLLSSVKLSDNIDPNMDDETFLEKSEQFKKLRKEIDNDFLPKFMEENGGDYKIMKKYFIAQGHFSSWETSCATLKGFQLLTRENLDEESYFLENPEFTIPSFEEENRQFGYDDDENEEEEESECEYVRNYEKEVVEKRENCREYEGPFGKDGFIKHFQETSIDETGSNKTYVETQIAYRAFIAIALSCMDIPDLDKEAGELVVSRTVAEYSAEQLPGIAESTSLGAYKSQSKWVPLDYSYEKGFSAITMKVPICDVVGVYFLSQGLCHSSHHMVCSLNHMKVIDVQTGLGKKQRRAKAA